MSNYKNIIYKVSLLFLFIIVYTGCKDNDSLTETEIEENEVQLSFLLHTGSMDAVRSGETDENLIEEVHILVFEEKNEDSDNFEYVYERPLSVEGNKADIKLRVTPNRVKLCFIANFSDIPVPLSGESFEEIRNELVTSFSQSKPTSLPMSYEIVFDNLNSSEPFQQPLDISLLRSLASVKVQLADDDDLKETFQLASLQAYRANSHIQIIPTNYEKIEGKQTVSEPSIPTQATNNIITDRTGDTMLPTDFLETLYIPEAEGYENENDLRTKATCLIIGGYYGKDNTDHITYYRIDLKAKDTPAGQILRNHLYEITITNITGPGTTHPDEAIEVNIQYTMYDWTDSNHNIEL